MIKTLAITIHSIVAIQAVGAEGDEVSLGEGNIHLTVASLAGVRGEGRNVPLMTIIAGERFVRSRQLVTV